MGRQKDLPEGINMADLFDLFDLLGVEEEPVKAKKEEKKVVVPAAKTTEKKTSEKSSAKASEKTLKTEQVKHFVMLSKRYDVRKGDFEKKTMKMSDLIRFFAEKIGYPKPEALDATFDYSSSTLYVAYKTNTCLAETAMLPESFVGYTFLGKECEYRLHDALSVEGIRNAVDVSDAEVKDAQYGFIVLSDNCVVPVLCPAPFAIPFAEKVNVSVDGEDVELSFKKEEKPVAKPEPDGDDETDDEEEAEEEIETSTEDFKELGNEEIEVELSKKMKNPYVKVAKLGERLIAVPSTVKANKHTVSTVSAPKEVRVPITDNLRIYWGWGELKLKGLPELEGKTDVSMEEALKILQTRRPEYSIIKKMEWYKDQEFWYPNYPTSSKGVDVTDEDGRFLLPRVPNELLGEMLCTFAEYACKGLEYACAFIFDTRTESWRLSFPDQEISPVSVNCNFGEDCEIPYEFVAIQAHSHHKMKCSFSSVDDRDEIMEGPVFIVAHSYDEAGNAFELECRTRRNGEYVYLDAEDVFQY